MKQHAARAKHQAEQERPRLKEQSDSERFTDAMSQVAGKRLTFAEVSGKLHKQSPVILPFFC